MSRRIALTSIILFLILHSAKSQKYSDSRPMAALRMDAKDFGVVLRYGDGPDNCDIFGARDVWVFKAIDSTFFLHYDAAGPNGWLASLENKNKRQSIKRLCLISYCHFFFGNCQCAFNQDNTNNIIKDICL